MNDQRLPSCGVLAYNQSAPACEIRLVDPEQDLLFVQGDYSGSKCSDLGREVIEAHLLLAQLIEVAAMQVTAAKVSTLQGGVKILCEWIPEIL